LHDIAIYDVAASIDHILTYTGQSKLSMIGHSAAGNEFYALLSEKPSYNEKIKVMISWGSSPVIKRFDCPLLAFVISISSVVKVCQRQPSLREVTEFTQNCRVCYIGWINRNCYPLSIA